MTDIQVRSCLPDNESLIAKRVGQTGYHLYATKDFVDTHDCHNVNASLATLPWIGISPDHIWYPLQKRWLDGYFKDASKVRCNTMTAMLKTARTGVGIALLPAFMASSCPDLVKLTESDSEPKLRTVEYLIVHRDLLRESAIRLTVDAVASLFLSHSTELSS